MTTDTTTHKAQLEIVADSTGVETAADRGKRSLRDLGKAARDAGREAGEGLKDIGAGGDTAAARVESATRQIQRTLERTIAGFDAGERGSRKFFESLAAQRGADVAQLQPLLDQLEAVRARTAAAEAAERARAEAAAAASQREVAAARAMANIRAAAQAAEREAYQAQQAAAASAAKAREDFIAGLERQANAIGKSRSELLEMQAAQMGVTAQAAPHIARLREAEQGMGKVGQSAAQTAAAMRMIPMQMTDVVTSLASGMPPLMVLVQQGGQIKDVFGGIGPAVRAVGGYIAGLVTPVTATATAVAVLALGYERGAEEGRALERALILTGNAAGVTTSQLQANARAVAANVGTQAQAVEALKALLDTGRVGADQLQAAAAVAVQSERLLGTAVGDTAKQFADLGKSPLQASLRLNESQRYLTVAVLEQITALERQGRTAEAAAVAQQAYADAMATRLQQVQGSLGGIERAWLRVKEEAARAWDSMLNIGREVTLGDRVNAAAEKLAMLTRQEQGRAALNALGVTLPANDGSERAMAQEVYGLLSRQLAAQQGVAAAAGDAAKQTESRAKWDQDSLQYLSRRQQMEEAVTKARNEGAAAGVASEEVERRVARIRANYDTGVNVVAVQASEQQRLEVIKRAQIQVDLLRETGAINERAQIEETTRLDLQALEVRRQALQAQLAIARSRPDSEREVASIQGQLAALTEQRLTREAEGRKQVTVLIEKQRDAISALLLVQQQETRDEVEAARRQDEAARNRIEISLLDYNRALREQGELDQLELSLLGQGNVSRQVKLKQFQVELELRKRLREIDETSGPSIDESWREQQRANARAAAATASAQAETRVYLDEWQRTSEQIGQSLSDALMQGGKSASEYLKGLFRTMVLRPVLQAAISPITGAIAQTFAPGGAASVGGSAVGMLNAASGASTLYTAGSSLYTLGSQWLGGTMSTANVAGTAFANATGAGLDGLLATNGAYGTAAAGSASATAGSFLSTAAAAAPYIAAALVVANGLGLFKGTEQRDTGLAGTVGDSVDVRQFNLMREDGSLFSGPSYWLEYQQANAPLVAAIQNGIGGMLATYRAQAGALGQGSALNGFTARLGSEVVDSDTGTIGISLDGLNGDQALQKIQAELSKVADQAAAQALGDAGLALAAAGETASQTLSRLSTDITAVNAMLSAMSKSLLQTSISGAGAAAQLVAAFGGLDAMQSGVQAYLDAAYTDEEKAARQRDQVNKAFSSLGFATPQTLQQYRALVDAQDLTTDAGRAAYVQLVDVATAFRSVTDAAEESRAALQEIGRTLQDEIDRLRGSSGSTDAASLQARFAVQTAAARAGETTALQSLPEISRALEEASAATAASALDVARMRAWLASSLEQTLHIAVPAYADGGVHPGGWAVVGDGGGPELVNMGPSRVYDYTASRSLLDTSRLEAQVEALQRQVAALEGVMRANAGHTAAMAARLDSVIDDDALITRGAD